MNIVRLNNIWNVQFLNGKLDRFAGVGNSFIIHQSIYKPIIPDEFSLEETEQLAIYLSESDEQRVALWIYADDETHREIISFVFSVYDDARVETA